MKVELEAKSRLVGDEEEREVKVKSGKSKVQSAETTAEDPRITQMTRIWDEEHPGKKSPAAALRLTLTSVLICVPSVAQFLVLLTPIA
jgi:hypothetical protein